MVKPSLYILSGVLWSTFCLAAPAEQNTSTPNIPSQDAKQSPPASTQPSSDNREEGSKPNMAAYCKEHTC